ncbi:uncharacterized protein LOC120172091 [Hibiscus syriacus]|uniref:uncharacterized protein LOC120172091 n=1 Tax=Hibiscus syriacus TaxID=106335 RepID=UPI001924CB59|nr:uncharacterized protein LOC120172091 [Hibiscus syriacus]
MEVATIWEWDPMLIGEAGRRPNTKEHRLMAMQWLKPGMSAVNLTATACPKVLNFMDLGNAKAVFMSMRKIVAGWTMVSVIIHGNYEITEAYGYEETNGYGEYANNGVANGYREYANNGMARSHPHLRGKHSGHGNGFVSTQSYGGGRRYHADNGHSAKGPIWNNWGKNSCNDSDIDSDTRRCGLAKHCDEFYKCIKMVNKTARLHKIK